MRIDFGTAIIYSDHQHVEHDALITGTILDREGHLVLCYVSSNPADQDAYGRQVLRAVDVPHWTETHESQYWRTFDETVPIVTSSVQE